MIMVKSKSARFFLGAVVVLAGVAVVAVATPDSFVPAVTKVRQWTKSAPTTATVHGQVRFAGEVLPLTRLELHTPQGVFATYTDANGTYELRGVPAGEARVTIHTPEWLRLPGAPGENDDDSYPIPEGPFELLRHYRSA